MKSIRNYAVAVAAGAVLMLAGYSQNSYAIACTDVDPLPNPPRTFQDLIDVGECTIGDKTFSNFEIQGDLTGADVSFAVINGPVYWGFNFQFNLSILGAGTSKDFKIDYDIACTNGLACIDSIHADITAGGTGGGVASLAENYELGSFFLFTPGGPTSFSADFPAVATLHVSKDLNVICPPQPDGTCLVTFSGLINTVDQVEVPEPGSLALLAGGLLALGWIGRRRRDRT